MELRKRQPMLAIGLAKIITVLLLLLLLLLATTTQSARGETNNGKSEPNEVVAASTTAESAAVTLQRERGQVLSYVVRDAELNTAVKMHLTTVHAPSGGGVASIALTMDGVPRPGGAVDLSRDAMLLFLVDRSDRVSYLMAPRGQPEDQTALLLFALRFLRGEQRGAVQLAHAVVNRAAAHRIVERVLRLGDATHQVISLVDASTSTLLASKIQIAHKSSIARDASIEVELFSNVTLPEEAMKTKFPESLHFDFYGHYDEDARSKERLMSGKCGLHDEERAGLSCLWGCRVPQTQLRCCHRVVKFAETCHVFIGRFTGHEHDSVEGGGLPLSRWTPCHQVALRMEHEGTLSRLSFDSEHYRGLADLCF